MGEARYESKENVQSISEFHRYTVAGINLEVAFGLDPNRQLFGRTEPGFSLNKFKDNILH